MAGGDKPRVSQRGRRQKGSTFERELVNFLREGGLDAKRVPLSGATEFQKGDVVVTPGYAPDAAMLVGECKRRASLPALFSHLGEHDFLAMRADRGETLIVLRAGLFRDLLQ
jgi:hypothetical protein